MRSASLLPLFFLAATASAQQKSPPSFAERMLLATREQHLADRFTSAHPEVAVRTVPAAAGDVHDLDGLRGMAEALTGPDGDTPTGTPRTRVLPARRG